MSVRAEQAGSAGALAADTGAPAKSPERSIVFVCQVFYPDPTSTSQLFTGLLREIGKSDAGITVLCGFPSGDGGGKHDLARREQSGDINIVRCGLRIDHKKSRWHRALSYFAYLLHVSWTIFSIRKPDILFGVTNPPFSCFLLAVASYVKRLPFQYMILDMYPDGLVALGTLRDDSVVTRMWRAANRLSYRRATKLVVLGRDMIPLLESRYGIARDRCAYIPHWSPVETGAPATPEQDGNRAVPPRNDRFVVQYSGNMGLWHDMDALVRAAAKLQEESEIHFQFIGDGMRRQPAETLSRELGLRNVSWHDFVPLERLGESLASCDLALISQRAGLEGIAVPCKLYGILAAGRAIVAQVPAGSEVALTVTEHECGVVVAPGDVDGLAAAIRTLAQSPATVRRMGERALCAYREQYTIAQAVDAVSALWDVPRSAGAPAIEPCR